MVRYGKDYYIGVGYHDDDAEQFDICAEVVDVFAYAEPGTFQTIADVKKEIEMINGYISNPEIEQRSREQYHVMIPVDGNWVRA